MRLSEIGASIGSGKVLIVPCQGDHKCAGCIRIPFAPTIGGVDLMTRDGELVTYWRRVSGETLEDITLEPSIDADDCGHFFIVEGEVRRA